MATNFKTLTEAGAAFDALSARIDVLTRDLKFNAVRTELQPRLNHILAGYNGVTIPAADPASGVIDPDALETALVPLGDKHPHSMPDSRRQEVRSLLTSMGLLA